MTQKTIDYYLSPQSPWTYLGHERFAQVAKAAGATINVLPVDLGGCFRCPAACRCRSGRRSARPTAWWS